jgi:hypothetical protein
LVSKGVKNRNFEIVSFQYTNKSYLLTTAPVPHTDISSTRHQIDERNCNPPGTFIISVWHMPGLDR